MQVCGTLFLCAVLLTIVCGAPLNNRSQSPQLSPHCRVDRTVLGLISSLLPLTRSLRGRVYLSYVNMSHLWFASHSSQSLNTNAMQVHLPQQSLPIRVDDIRVVLGMDCSVLKGFLPLLNDAIKDFVVTPRGKNVSRSLVGLKDEVADLINLIQVLSSVYSKRIQPQNSSRSSSSNVNHTGSAVVPQPYKLQAGNVASDISAVAGRVAIIMYELYRDLLVMDAGFHNMRHQLCQTKRR